MTYRNSSTSQQARTTYVFYTSVSLTAGKIVQSVALPGTVTQGRLHIFAVGVGWGARAVAWSGLGPCVWPI